MLYVSTGSALDVIIYDINLSGTPIDVVLSSLISFTYVGANKRGIMAITRIPTGIEGFDKAIQGGFKKHSVNLFAGGAGSGKSTLAMEFLINGITKFNESGIYISFEETSEELKEDMLEYGWDLDKFEKQGKLKILEYMPEQVKKLLAEGGGLIEEDIKKLKAKRVVIDSVNSFTLMYENRFSKRKASLKLFELLRGWGLTTILIAEDEEPLEDQNIVAELEFEADSLIFLYNLRKKGKRHRAIEIEKMRGTKHVDHVMELVLTKKGAKVNPAKIISI